MTPEILWNPPADAWDRSRLGAFARRHHPESVGDYAALLAWSVDEPAAFWSAVWAELDVIAHAPPTTVLGSTDLPGAVWFPGARINYAEHVLRGGGMGDDAIVVIGESQSRGPRSTTLAELRDEVRRAAAGLRRLGVGPGDRVAAYLPNIEETLVAFLATASLGAIWSSCAPEFGTRSVLDRWTQIEPSILLTVDGYRYGAKDLPSVAAVTEIRRGLPTVATTIVVPYLDGADPIPDALAWDELTAPTGDGLVVEPVPFDHPLYVLYSSGTTGLPKPIVHGHGGILLEHGKELALQFDLGVGDRFFWFSTTGWMMWNFLVSAPLAGSAMVLFDGNPGHPDLDTLWSLMARSGSTWAGVAAPFVMACRDAGLRPATDHDLSALRGLGSTGAPLPAAGFHWLSEEVGHLPIHSISGGTDVCSAFVGGAPVLPVRPGVIAGCQLGWRIEAFDADGQPLIGREGELVITAPAPSMPVGFWGDDDGSRYLDTYFSTYPGVWRHGDWVTMADDGSCVISGRSDATLNRGGVRLGTADFYAVVESDPAIADSLVVHLEDDQGGLGELILFAAPAAGRSIDDDVRHRVATTLRRELSPRHAPDEIVSMPEIPRTLSGKKLEVPVKRILRGADRDQAASVGALANPASLDPYVDWAAARRGRTATPGAEGNSG